jgi:hypothetical protein
MLGNLPQMRISFSAWWRMLRGPGSTLAKLFHEGFRMVWDGSQLGELESCAEGRGLDEKGDDLLKRAGRAEESPGMSLSSNDDFPTKSGSMAVSLPGWAAIASVRSWYDEDGGTTGIRGSRTWRLHWVPTVSGRSSDPGCDKAVTGYG